VATGLPDWFSRVQAEMLFLFLDLSDVPADYVGSALKGVRVNAAESGLEFASLAHTLASHTTKAHAELTNVTSDQHHAENHYTRHEAGGADEISVEGLLGLLADPQTPKEDLIGEGHINIFSWNYDSVGQGAWTNALDPYMFCNGRAYNSSNANGDNISWKVYLAKGAYTLRVATLTDLASAIVDFDIDGVEVASFDLYSNPRVDNVIFTKTGIVIAASGLKTLRMRADGHNDSSIGWYAYFSVLALWRTV